VPGSAGEQEVQWKRAAGLILLAGVLSLLTSFGRGEDSLTAAQVAPTAAAEQIEKGSQAMDQRESAGTDERIGARTSALGMQEGPASSAEEGPSFSAETVRLASLDTGDGGPSELSAGAVLGRMESVIQRYPWPALIVGMGLGYFLARQVR